MSFISTVDDFMDTQKKQGKKRLGSNPPLVQGARYLNDRSLMCKGLQPNLKLIEGFQDQTGTNKHVVAGLTHATDKDDVNFRQPVFSENTKEWGELIAMQKSLKDVQTEFKSRVQDYITQARGQKVAHQTCLKKCDNENNIDSKSACQYGCNIGYFANQGPNARRVGNEQGQKLAPPAAAVLAEIFGSVAGSAVAAVAMPGMIAGGAAAGISAENFQGREGFSPGAPETTGGGSADAGNNNYTMGYYGTTGTGKQNTASDTNAQRAIGGTQINKLLGNVPVHDDGTAVPGQPSSGDSLGKVQGYQLFSGYKYHNMTPQESLDQYPNSMAGLRAQAVNTANIKLMLSKQIDSGSLTDQMAAANLNSTNIGDYMTKLRSQWKTVFQKACGYGIGGVANSDGAKFAGHTQHCTSFVPTAEGRSSFYSQQNPNAPSFTNPGPNGDPYTVTSQGVIAPNAFTSKPVALANVGKLGCDTPIPSSYSSATGLGGSGFCECKDGTFRYVDAGHPTFTCNQACAPQNAGTTKSGPLYHNSKNWKPALPYTPNASQAQTLPFLQKGSMPGKFVGGKGSQPPACSSGMVQQGDLRTVQSQNNPPAWNVCGWWGAGPCSVQSSKPGWWGMLTETATRINIPPSEQLGRDCRYPKPSGYQKPLVDNIGKLKKLQTAQQLVDTCSGGSSPDAPYGNIHLDYLEIKVLGLVMLKKAAILYDAIKQSYSGSNAATLKQTAEGKELLKNLSVYERAFKALRAQKSKEMVIQGMLEDVRLKKGSVHISYYLWFALAIAGAGLVIKKLNN